MEKSLEVELKIISADFLLCGVLMLMGNYNNLNNKSLFLLDYYFCLIAK